MIRHFPEGIVFQGTDAVQYLKAFQDELRISGTDYRPIIFITGPPAAGKTRLGWDLMERLDSRCPGPLNGDNLLTNVKALRRQIKAFKEASAWLWLDCNMFKPTQACEEELKYYTTSRDAFRILVTATDGEMSPDIARRAVEIRLCDPKGPEVALINRKPTSPGWYWCQSATWKAVVRVDETAETPGLFCTWLTAPGKAKILHESQWDPNCRWFGPIPSPES